MTNFPTHHVFLKLSNHYNVKNIAGVMNLISLTKKMYETVILA